MFELIFWVVFLSLMTGVERDGADSIGGGGDVSPIRSLSLHKTKQESYTSMRRGRGGVGREREREGGL
jgi:hypothetical protein